MSRSPKTWAFAEIRYIHGKGLRRHLRRLKKGKEVADYIVENELFKAAQQQIVTIKEPIKVRTEKQKVGSGKVVEEHIEYVEKQIIVPGNVTAQIYWLNNRRPDKWRNSRDGDRGANDSDVIDSFLEVMESEQQ